ncbi:sugar transferase [Arthrobacter sp. UKPF54-2]|uniref:sugar transferase n=1 Tax=Arthrobacter sp. UKPF54-2 TaxID=2600159 RepID=UPI0011B1A312|nr:sugar transferase [Arthrobacter sp. UKPF54-2]QDY89891.1 sugar transferase [Arthrobacter sp. UKPF54-2]
MSELKQRRHFHATARVAAPPRSANRLHTALRHQHSVREDEPGHALEASRAVVSRMWRNFANRLRLTDAAGIAVAVTSAYLLRFDSDAAAPAGDGFEARYVVVSVLLLGGWLAVLEIFHTRDRRTLGVGGAEYKRVIQATLKLFGALAIAMVFVRFDALRGYFAVALPLGIVLLTGSRWLWRKWLNRKRSEGRYLSRVIVIGDRADVEYIISQFEKNPSAGYEISGVGLPTLDQSMELRPPWYRIPVVSTLADVSKAVELARADAVVVAGHVPGGSTYIRELGWNLEATGTELVLASSLTNVAGPRIHFRPVDGLPLVHVELPQYFGGKHVLKRVIDIAVAALALVALSPLMLVVALIVKRDSPGPVLFRQQRAGKNGAPFQMLKFRSMVETAEADLDALRELNEGCGPLFKIRNDPRISRCGRWMRKYSLDELPQLWNVLTGEMSLVGPRPPLPSEVERYERFTSRRLLIKPGITGLWQVNGRSTLPWEESIRLDLYYVENWSLTGDLIIMWRTFRAIRTSTGAY